MSNEPKIEFRPKFLEDSRKFIITPKQAKFLYQHVGIKKRYTVLDVGCGTGFFTREIAKYQKYEGKVLGVDINPNLILEANNLKETFDCIEFIVGDGQALDFATGRFDTTLCHFLLSRLPEDTANRVIQEMVRVTKVGGTVSAVEPCLGAMVAQYYDDYELSVMLTRLRRAKSETQKLVNRINENIGGELFGIFRDLGLKNVSVEVLALPWWTPPAFHASQLETDHQLREWYTRRLDALEKPEDEKVTRDYGKVSDAAQILRAKTSSDMSIPSDILERVGITPELMQLVNNHRMNYLQQLLTNPGDRYVNDFELIPVFAVTGTKRS